MLKVLIIGATSAIAEATARKLAAQGARLHLLARNRARLESLSRDLKIRGAPSVTYAHFEANDFSSHQAAIDQAISALEQIDVCLIAHGTLSDQKKCEQSFELTLSEFHTNLLSVISLLTYLANYFEARRAGTIAVIGSVAGDRGRKSNYIYGAAKGAVAIFLQGLRNRLYEYEVSVITIKPGFVDTPMTAAFKKSPLWSHPETIANGIVKALERKGRDIVYLPRFWQLIMFLICSIPERIFKRLSIGGESQQDREFNQESQAAPR